MTDEIEGKEESSALRVYEVGYLLLPSVPEEHIPEFVLSLRNVITKGNGGVLSEEEALMRPLAYEMIKTVAARNERFKTAYFGWIKFETTPKEALEVKKALDMMETVLRFILIKTVRETPAISRSISEEESAISPAQTTVSSKKASDALIDKTIDELVVE